MNSGSNHRTGITRQLRWTAIIVAMAVLVPVSLFAQSDVDHTRCNGSPDQPEWCNEPTKKPNPQKPGKKYDPCVGADGCYPSIEKALKNKKIKSLKLYPGKTIRIPKITRSIVLEGGESYGELSSIAAATDGSCIEIDGGQRRQNIDVVLKNIALQSCVDSNRANLSIWDAWIDVTGTHGIKFNRGTLNVGELGRFVEITGNDKTSETGIEIGTYAKASITAKIDGFDTGMKIYGYDVAVTNATIVSSYDGILIDAVQGAKSTKQRNIKIANTAVSGPGADGLNITKNFGGKLSWTGGAFHRLANGILVDSGTTALIEVAENTHFAHNLTAAVQTGSPISISNATFQGNSTGVLLKSGDVGRNTNYAYREPYKVVGSEFIGNATDLEIDRNFTSWLEFQDNTKGRQPLSKRGKNQLACKLHGRSSKNDPIAQMLGESCGKKRR